MKTGERYESDNTVWIFQTETQSTSVVCTACHATLSLLPAKQKIRCNLYISTEVWSAENAYNFTELNLMTIWSDLTPYMLLTSSEFLLASSYPGSHPKYKLMQHTVYIHQPPSQFWLTLDLLTYVYGLFKIVLMSTAVRIISNGKMIPFLM